MTKNVQVVDGAVNMALDIYEVEDEYFNMMFPEEADVAFLSDLPELKADSSFWNQLNKCPIDKKTVQGIHGTLHLESSPAGKKFFPTRRESDHRRYAAYCEYDRHWVDDHMVHCTIKMDGRSIATFLIDLVKDSATIVDGGFSAIPHNEISMLKHGKTHEQSMLEHTIESTRMWAENNK